MQMFGGKVIKIVSSDTSASGRRRKLKQPDIPDAVVNEAELLTS